MFQNHLSLVFGNLVIHVGTVRFQSIHNIEWCSRYWMFASANGTTVNHDRWPIKPGHGHDAPGLRN